MWKTTFYHRDGHISEALMDLQKTIAIHSQLSSLSHLVRVTSEPCDVRISSASA